VSKYEKFLQWAKIVLLAAILCFTVWSVGTRPPVEAQLAASSGFQFKHISTATNTPEASATVILHTIVINGGTAGAITVKDTAAADCSGGTTIAVIATLTGSSAQTLAYDLQTSTGLCLTTAAATDVTVSYR
jgi:hypothetical protein